MSYIFETVTGNTSALGFHFNGQFAIKNYDVEIINGNRLKIVSQQNEMFSLLEADVSEIEINGFVYSDPLAAQVALKALVSSTNEPVVMTKEMYLDLSAAVQAADRGKILPTTPIPSGGWLPGWYTPGLFENADPGTNYPNQNDLKAKKGFITRFLFNGIWDSIAYELPQASSNIRIWAAQNYMLNDQVIKDNVQYIAPSGALPTDIPSLKSTVWKVVGDAFPQKSAILEPTKNLFDKNSVVNGFYINTSTGTLDADATSAVSEWITVNPSKVYYLSGRTASINNIRFKDASGTILPPMVNATTPAVNYSKVANLVVYVPPSAVAIQFMVKFSGSGSVNAVQFEEGINPTFYEPFGYKNILLPSVLPVEKKDIRVKRVVDMCYVAMPFSSTQEIVQKLNVFRNGQTDNLNNNVNFENEYLINRGSDITVSGVALKNSNDDIAPPNLNGSYIGGNHGWNQPQKITKTAHGKTFSDIGKIGTDTTGKQFTILQIIDANNFVLIGRNIAIDGFTYNFPTPTGDIAFSSGVISGYTFASMGNTFEFIKSADRKILINGKTELLSGEEKYADYVDVIDIYDVIDLNSVVEILITNANYSSNPDFTNIGADKLLRVEIVYRFIGNNCLINQTFFNYKKINLSFLPFIQTLPLDSGNLYINKLLPISDGVKTWDFRKGEIWTTPTSIIQLSKATWESATNPPDRFVQFTSSYSFATGFVKDKGHQRETNNSAGWLHTTRKIYPYGVNVGATILNPYQSYSLQCFRNYQNKSIYPSGRISKVEWLDNGEYYLMLDWNASVFETINLPKEVIGKSIKIVEKTTNVTVLSSVASAQLCINVVVDVSNVYGYLVLKITN